MKRRHEFISAGGCDWSVARCEHCGIEIIGGGWLTRLSAFLFPRWFGCAVPHTNGSEIQPMMTQQPDPGLNPPPQFYALQTYLAIGSEVGYRSFLFLDPEAADTAGQKFLAEKPAEATSANYKVVPLEAWQG